MCTSRSRSSPMAIHNVITFFAMYVLVHFNGVTGQLHYPMSNVKNYMGEWKVCSSANSVDVHLRPLLSTVDARSQMDCLRKCFRVSECETALFNNSKSCLLLGPLGDVTVNNADLRGDSCFVIYLNPCYNGGVFINNNVCQCPKSYTGQYCQIVNDERCDYPFNIIYGLDEQVNITNDTVLKDLLSPNFKMAFVKDKTSFYNTGPAQFLINEGREIVATEVMNIISKSNVSSFEPFPKFNGYVMSSTFLVHEASVSFDGTLVTTPTVLALGAYVFARVPVNEYVVMKEGIHGTVDDVIKAILFGYEPMNVAAMTFQETSKQVIEHRVKAEVGTYENSQFIIPLYYYNDKIDLNGNKGIYRHKMNGDFNYGSATNINKDIVFDPCWFDATLDSIREPQEDKNIKYLKAALRNGKRARVVFDGISAKTVATYVTKDYVLFQVSPYLSPKHTTLMDNTTNVVHSVVATDGRVKTCAHRMLNSTSTGQSEYVNDDVRWFVDSRTWKLVYETELDGSYISGSLEELHNQIVAGVDVQIVVETPSLNYSLPGGWMATDPWGDNLQRHSSAEIKNILRLWVDDTDFQLVEDGYCTLSSILLSSQLGWQALSYKYGFPDEFNTYTLGVSTGNIKWFVSGEKEG